MNTKEQNTINQLIAGYLGGDLSKDEIQQLELWINESDENLAYFRQMKNIWESSGQLTISTEKALEKVMKRLDKTPKGLSFWYFLQKAAAILFIPLLIAALWLGNERNSKISNEPITYNKVVAAFGTFSSMVLPDGSKVWLNAGSSIQYPDKFSGNKRLVYLSGEAYFEVHSDKAQPFFVSTPYFTVKATGTRFNVMAGKSSEFPSVTLVEGKVDIRKGNSENKNQMLSELRPSQHMIYNTSTGQVKVQTEDTYKYIAWKDGKLVFRNDVLTEVARRISLQYNVDIDISGEHIKQYRYRATFENEPLSELLRLLKISSPIDYREIKPAALPDGSFSRRKIIIFSAAK
jgi:transmembrane sensor